MGWIIFVIVVLVVLGITRRRTTKARARMSQQMSVLQSLAHQPGPTSQSYPGGQPLPGQQLAGGSAMGSRQGAQSLQAFQAMLAGRTLPAPAPGYQPRGTATYPAADQPTFEPVGPVAPRPRATPPPSQLTRYQGSTAVSGSSLNSTLFTPYQPSSLTTSLSSSLASSLTDSPPRMGRTTAFGGVEIISLPDDVADQVRYHLRNGHEVEAVRLVCDTMNVGLLEATKTVRSYA